MRYLTHQFAHIETLERAKRWLVSSGIDPTRIEARTHGILTLSVALDAGQSAEVQRIIDAAESSDPDGNPGMWDAASHPHVSPPTDTAPPVTGHPMPSESFVVNWQPQDAGREVTQTDTELQKIYREGKD